MGCCCCLGNKNSTIISSIIHLFIAITGSAIFLAKSDDIAVKLPHEIAITFGILFIIISIVFVYGIIAASLKSPNGVKVYVWILIGVSIIYFVITITTIIYVFMSKQLATEQCNNEYKVETSTIPSDYCDRRENINVWVRTILLISLTIFEGHLLAFANRLRIELTTSGRRKREKSKTHRKTSSTFSGITAFGQNITV